MSEKWKKAIPLFLSGGAYVAMGVFALLGSVPAWWIPVVTTAAFALSVFLHIQWTPPSE